MSQSNDAMQFFVGNLVVGFFDLLGQQKRLREIVEIPSQSNEEGNLKLRDQIRSSYGVVLGMRGAFKSFFDGYSKSTTDVSSLTEEQQMDFANLTAHDIRLQPMSDSLLAYTRALGPGPKVSIKGILGMVAAAGATQLACLASGHPIRGGIDIGIGIVANDQEFYGPALSRAYTLESKIAQYPRIVLGDELVNFLHALSIGSASTIEDQMAKVVATKCVDLIAEDIDGQYFVDFLGQGFKKNFGDQFDLEFVSSAINNVFETAKIARKAKDHQLSVRYALLSDYCGERAALWGVTSP